MAVEAVMLGFGESPFRRGFRRFSMRGVGSCPAWEGLQRRAGLDIRRRHPAPPDSCYIRFHPANSPDLLRRMERTRSRLLAGNADRRTRRNQPTNPKTKPFITSIFKPCSFRWTPNNHNLDIGTFH